MLRKVVFLLLIAMILSDGRSEQRLKKMFKSFRHNFNRTYSFDEKKFQTFMESINEIETIKSPLYRQECNKFCDVDENEFQEYLMNDTSIISIYSNTTNIEENNNEHLRFLQTSSAYSYETINWKHLFTDPKEQSTCGSCWCFSMIGAAEGNFAKKYGAKQRFSEQQVLDCTPINNCRGGWVDYSEPKRVKSFTRDTDYVYVNKKNTCNTNKNNYVEVTDSEKCENCTFQQWYDLLKKGPIAMGINSAHLRLYASGIIDTKCRPSARIDHAIVAVGATPYNETHMNLTFRNSWGTNWGENGYFNYIYELGSNYTDSCLVTKYAYLPIVSLHNDTAIVYDYCEYTGNFFILNKNETNILSNLNSIGFDNIISSIQLGQQTNITAYKGVNYTESSFNITSDIACLKDIMSAYDNELSSVSFYQNDVTRESAPTPSPILNPMPTPPKSSNLCVVFHFNDNSNEEACGIPGEKTPFIKSNPVVTSIDFGADILNVSLYSKSKSIKNKNSILINTYTTSGDITYKKILKVVEYVLTKK